MIQIHIIQEYNSVEFVNRLSLFDKICLRLNNIVSAFKF